MVLRYSTYASQLLLPLIAVEHEDREKYET